MEGLDESLVAAHLQGDPAAFRELVRRYGDGVLGYLFRMTGNRDQAEDLFQETFKRVHEKARTFRGGSFKSWLFTIATRIAIDRLRRNKRQPAFQSLESDDPLDAGGRNPAEEAAQQELRATVQATVELLPPKQRAALVLAYYQGHTYPEIAAIMGCSLSTVKTHMSRALKTLAGKLPRGGSL